MAAIPSYDLIHSVSLRDTSTTMAAHHAPPALISQRLLQGQREVLIRHGGETYRLRHTRNDKLILTK